MPNPEFVWFVLAFGLLWVGIFAGVSYFGGWHGLAREFLATVDHPGRRFLFVSGSFGPPYFPVNYNHCLTVTVADAGLTLRMLLPFRIFHPTLFIPWSAVASIETTRIWWFKYQAITLRGYNMCIALHGATGLAALEGFDNSRRSNEND